MKLIITDGSPSLLTPAGEHLIVADNTRIIPCSGCCGCLKKPRCRITDSYELLPELIGQSKSLILVSRCHFGSVGRFVKAAADKALFRRCAYAAAGKRDKLPPLTLSAFLYGEKLSEQEITAVRTQLSAMTKSSGCDTGKVVFLKSPEAIRGIEL